MFVHVASAWQLLVLLDAHSRREAGAPQGEKLGRSGGRRGSRFS